MTADSSAASLSKSSTLAQAPSRAEALRAALVAFAIGVALVFVVGFAHPDALHNAAHDTRHALSFPCH